MKKFLTTLAVLTAFATPAFAQSFEPVRHRQRAEVHENRLLLPNENIAAGQSGLHSFAMVPEPRSAFNPYSPPATGLAASAIIKCSVTSEPTKKERAPARPLFLKVLLKSSSKQQRKNCCSFGNESTVAVSSK